MQSDSRTRFIPIGLMLFALFFGAGNLIFPASMGQASGTDVWWALLGFCITGVGLPLLTVMAVGYSGLPGLREIGNRVHPLSILGLGFFTRPYAFLLSVLALLFLVPARSLGKSPLFLSLILLS